MNAPAEQLERDGRLVNRIAIIVVTGWVLFIGALAAVQLYAHGLI